MEGWIKISRELPKHWIWCDAERLKWWLDLLLSASWEDIEMMHDGNKFTLKRGQMIAPVSLLAKRWGKSAPTVIKFLKLLETEGMIYRQTLYRQTSILTICNYASYQDSVDTLVDTQIDTLVYSNKEIKEILLKKDISKDISKKRNYPLKTEENDELDLPLFSPGEIEEKDIPQEFVDRWNNAVKLHNGILPKVARLSDARKEKIMTRYEEFKECGNPIEVFGVIIEKCFASTFLTKQWKVQFDWLFQNDKNWIKVYEGNYDNNPINTTQDNGNNSDDRYAARRRTETKATSWQDYSEVF